MLFSLVGLFVLTGCYKDIDETNIVNTTIPGPEIVEEFSGNLTVTVEDLGGSIVQDVTVFVYDQELTTNKYGIAHFENIPLDRSGTVVQAYRAGFLFGTATFNPIGGDNYLTMKVLPIQNLAVFNSNDNVTISVDGGGKVDVSSGSFEYKDGTAYSGEVEMMKYLINEEDNDYLDVLIGDHTGLAKNGTLKALEIYSAVAVFAYDLEGVELQLREGKTIRIELPLNPDYADLVSDQSKAWNFSQAKSTWLEEEVAYRDGSTLWGEVSQLGFWSYAKPYNYVNITAELKGEEDEALSHLSVSFYNNSIVASGVTDGDGKVYLKIPHDREITMSVSHSACADPIFEKVIPAQLDDHILEPQIISIQNLGRIIGNLNCQMDPVPNGMVICRTPNGSYQYTADENGDFDILLSEALCNNEVDVEIIGYDLQTGNESTLIVYQNASNNPITIDVCADCNFEVNIDRETLDPCDLLVELTAIPEGGSGDYAFQWEDSSAGQSTTVTTIEIFCVTVTDNITECEVVKCTNIIAPSALEGTISQVNNIDCQDYGLVEVEATGGKLPRTYNWSGPGGFNSQEPLLVDLIQEGTYSYTITDANECTFEGNQYIIDNSGTYALDVSTTDLNNVICGDVAKSLVLDCQGCPVDLSLAEWTLPSGASDFGSEIIATEMGIYQVSVQELNCVADGSIQLQKVDFVDPILDYGCDNGTYFPTMTNLEVGFSTSLTEIEYEALIEIFAELEVGDFSVISPYVTCEMDYQFVLPKYNGFSFNVNNTSCDGCIDGSIEIDTTADCTNCVFGDYYIYAQGDYQTDLKIANSEQLLGAGNYYLVAKSDSGCVLNSIALFIE